MATVKQRPTSIAAGRSPGFLDPIDGTIIRGWAQPDDLGERDAMVDVYIDRKFASRVPAKAYRADLEEAGIQGGFAAFAYEIPTAYQDGKSHSVDVRLADSSTSLKDAPQTFRVEQKDVKTLREKRKWAAKTLVHEAPNPSDIGVSLEATRKLAIVGTYHDAESHLGYHRVLLASLAEAGFTILVVHASDTCRPAIAQTDLPHCFTILKRNIGYDFGSLAVGVFAVSDLLHLVDELVLMNDSVLPLVDTIAPTITRLRALGTDVAACTDSFEHHHHLQSYLLWFGEPVCRSGCIPRFMAGYSFTSMKDQVITEGELGLSRMLRREGFSIGAIYPYQVLAAAWIRRYREMVAQIADLPGLPIDWPGAPPFKRALMERLDLLVNLVVSGKPLNPTHFFWDTLIEEFDFPFLKRELVIANPCGVPTYHKLGHYFAPGSAALRSMMEIRHRFGGNLVPPSFAPSDLMGQKALSSNSKALRRQRAA